MDLGSGEAIEGVYDIFCLHGPNLDAIVPIMVHHWSDVPYLNIMGIPGALHLGLDVDNRLGTRGIFKEGEVVI